MSTIKFTNIPIDHSFKSRGKVTCEVTAGSVNINGSILTFGVQGLASKYENEKLDDVTVWNIKVADAVQDGNSKSAVVLTVPLM